MKQTKKALLMSVVSLLIFASMLIGSTYAWFTDSVSSMGNKIMAGTLKVDLELLDAKSGEWSSIKESKLPLFNYDKWEPGYVDTKVLKVENEGSLALRWAAKLYTEDDLSILCDAIDVYVLPSENEIDYPIGRSLDGYTLVGTLRNFIDTIEETTYGTLEAGECAYLGIALKMRENAGNEYQGLSLGGAFDIRIVATQYSHESDSFDDQYDVNPAEPVIAARSATFSEGQPEVTLPLYHKGEQLLEVNVPAESLVDPTKPVTVVIDDIEPTFEVDANTRVFAYDINVTNIRSGLSEDEFITITVKLPKGLAGVKAYHNGKLIEDAVYDSATGNITFKTSHFSPFEFTTAEYEAKDLTELRKHMSEDGAYVKLANDIRIDLSKGSADRDSNLTVSGYHNAVHVKGKNVAVDLNGHSITLKCGDKYNSNSDVGALFYVGENSSLNIIDTVGGGVIKMESSVYAVWAPHNDPAKPSYAKIYSGIFIGDSYADDLLHPDNTDTPNENSCRALIYAGKGGNIDVYGGYFFYNNTPNDTLNRNNGAFNCTNGYEGDTPLITIHEGVMLIDDTYRQDPTHTSEFKNILKKYPDAKPTDPGIMDNSSIKLDGEDEGLYKISEVTLEEPLLIGDKEYSTWYRVSRAYQYKLTFNDAAGNELDSMYIWPSDGEVTVDAKDDTARGKLTGDYNTYFDGWANVGSDKITAIPADNTTDIVLYPIMKQRFAVRWVNENGEVIANTVATSGTTYKNLQNKPQDPESKYTNMKFDHWEIREKDSSGKVTYTNVSDSYKITKNITFYPYYNYDGGAGSIALLGHDTDGDGRYDYYTVEAATGLSGSVEIPGIVNGVPVTAITDLSGDGLNGLWGDGIKSVIIKDGVTEIGSSAFAGTASLNYVEVPTSVTKIGSNAFSSGWGALISKKVTIKYAGTWAQWQAACGGAGSDTNWDSGLGDGSTVECTDGNYRLSASWGDSNHNWSDWKKQS